MPAVTAPAWRAKLRAASMFGGVAAGADGEGDVAGCEQIFELFDEDAIIAGIVRPSRDQSHIVGKSDRAQPLAGGRRGALAKVAGHVRGQRRAASIAKKKDGPAAVIDLKEHSDEPVDGRQRKKMDSGG